MTEKNSVRIVGGGGAMEVYIIECYYYDSSVVKGVFSSYEKAKSYIEKMHPSATHEYDDIWYYKGLHLNILMKEVE